MNESKSKCNENIRRRNVYKDQASTTNISGRPFYDMMSCWRSLLSALLEDPNNQTFMDMFLDTKTVSQEDGRHCRENIRSVSNIMSGRMKFSLSPS